MSLTEHILELRQRLFVCLVAIGIGTIVGFVWYQNSVPHVETLGNILRGPYCSLPATARADLSVDGECRLLATSPFEMFLLRLKVGALAGLVFASPVWLTQVWGFITPGLKRTEKRWTFTFVSIAVLLFIAGAVLAYFVVDYGLYFLLTIGDETQVAALTGERYYNFLLALLLIFGVSFEVPLAISMLNVAGLISYEDMRDKRRIIVVTVFAFAAFVTPGQDPVSMVILAIALALMVEVSLQFCRINDRRRGKARPDWLSDDDESASAIAAPTPVGTPGSTAPRRARRPIPAPPHTTAAPTIPQPPTIGRADSALGSLAERSAADFDDVL
ncbi:MAG: twin-arginine translocase subunit TatC [Corynebacterium sp.]|nr:twin-arginine translocase subunit TatC [Corynebacterium sp.]